MSQDNIFREVDDELRSDRMRNLWRRFGPYVIGAAIAVVLLVAVNEGWTWWQKSNSARASDEFYAALDLKDGGDLAGAQAALDKIIASGNGGYAQIARFSEAGLLIKQGKTAEAVAVYDALGATEGNARLRELALILAANTLVDGGDVAAVQQRVGALATTGNPMRNAAREALGLTQYKAGQLEEARLNFEAVLVDPLASTDMRRRMQVYLGQLAAEGVVPPVVEAAPAEEAAPATEPAPAADAAPVTEPAPATEPAATTDAAPAAETAPAAPTATPAGDAAPETPASN